LEQVVKIRDGKLRNGEQLRSIHDKENLPPPPKPGEFDLLLTGFPW
jgi:hypothetical protein